MGEVVRCGGNKVSTSNLTPNNPTHYQNLYGRLPQTALQYCNCRWRFDVHGSPLRCTFAHLDERSVLLVNSDHIDKLRVVDHLSFAFWTRSNRPSRVTRRASCRTRAAFQLEILALRHHIGALPPPPTAASGSGADSCEGNRSFRTDADNFPAQRSQAVSCCTFRTGAYRSERLRRHIRRPAGSWRGDETYNSRSTAAGLIYIERSIPGVTPSISCCHGSVPQSRRGELGRRCRCRPCPYLNNVVEQDHRFIKNASLRASGSDRYRAH
jgi:hypothetical protein